jgi:Domain of unknown function (DUF6285)
MQPRPTTPELATAVREFLETEIIPTLTDARLKFRTLVAMNALSMIERSPLQEAHLRAEISSLAALLGEPVSQAELEAEALRLNALLSSRIRSGNAPDGTLEVLHNIAVDKLQVSSPGYLKKYMT